MTPAARAVPAPRTRVLAGLLALLAGMPGEAAATPAGAFDPAHTRFRFELRTLWGQKVLGEFPAYTGQVVALPDGQRQVRIALRTDAVVVAGSARYTQMARGEGFFDAARHPLIEFVSEPHPLALVRDGGELRGRLTMHGVSREESFQLAPAACDRPGLDCAVIARGSVDRRDYGLDGYRVVLGPQVRFTLHVRLQAAAE